MRKILLFMFIFLLPLVNAHYNERCSFGSKLMCEGLDIKPLEESYLLNITLRSKEPINILSIENCEIKNKQISDSIKISAECTDLSGYEAPSLVFILLPEFLMSGYKYSVSIKQTLLLHDDSGNTYIGEIWQRYAEPPQSLNSLKYKAKFVSIMSNILWFIIPLGILLFYLHKKKKMHFIKPDKMTIFILIGFIIIIVLAAFLELALKNALFSVFIEYLILIPLTFPLLFLGFTYSNIPKDEVLIIGIVVELIYLYVISILISYILKIKDNKKMEI